MRFQRLLMPAFLLAISAMPAGATVLISISGTVGDNNWVAVDGGYELKLDLWQAFPASNAPGEFDPHSGQGTGPGGQLTISYSGAAIVVSNDQSLFQDTYEQYRCWDEDGCTNGQGFQHQGGDDSGNWQAVPAAAGATSFTDTIDSTWRQISAVPQSDDFHGGIWSNEWAGNTDFVIDETVSAASFGQQFSVTVGTPDAVLAEAVSDVPEPDTWLIFIAGFAMIGAALRLRPAFQAQIIGRRAGA